MVLNFYQHYILRTGTRNVLACRLISKTKIANLAILSEIDIEEHPNINLQIRSDMC